MPARDAAATLDACLSGLSDAGFAPDDIIVVSDASEDRTPQIGRTFGARIVLTKTAIGAAAARNMGVAQSKAPLILFVDADVTLHQGVRDQVLTFFANHPDHAGLIGSYDDAPPAFGGLSRIRNLLHHHTHQGAGGDVASFWTGCGAIRRADFDAVGGFEASHPLEDVALGLALARRERRVWLDPTILCTHLKHWTLGSMARADLLYRALPWSRMLLDPRNSGVSAQLNAGRAGKLSVVVSGLGLLGLILVPLVPVIAGATYLTTLGTLAGLNHCFLRLVARRLGPLAAFQAVGVLWVHFCCAGTGFAWAFIERFAPGARSRQP